MRFIINEELSDGTKSVEETISIIKEKFGLSDGFIWSKNANHGEVNHILVGPEEKQCDDVKKAMEECGYFYSCDVQEGYFNGKKHILMQFEACNVSDDTEEIKNEQKVLYHITPLGCAPSILEKGLEPGSKNERFKYPNRIHLFFGNAGKGELLRFAHELGSAQSNRKWLGCCAILRIKTEELPENIKLYIDPNYQYGCYATETIPPSCIELFGIVDTTNGGPNAKIDNNVSPSELPNKIKELEDKYNDWYGNYYGL